MKTVKILVALLACIMLSGISTAAADTDKIGIIDFQKILRESEAGKKVQQQIQEEGQERQDALRELYSEIEELDKQLSRDSMVLDEEKRLEKQKQLNSKRRDFQSKREQYQRQFQKIESELIGKLQDEIFSIAEEIGEEEGYLLIIERSAAVYYPDSIDLTDRVIEKYDDRQGAGLPEEDE